VAGYKLSVQPVKCCKDYDNSFSSCFLVPFETLKVPKVKNWICGSLEGFQSFGGAVNFMNRVEGRTYACICLVNFS
jgi:hypothetical protein